ncbi:MAG TPA: S8 family serine peptidase [Propionibacteriaceae bacterium]
MTPRSRPRRWAATTTAAAVGALLVLGATPGASAQPAVAPAVPTAVPGRYIVTLAQPPLASYAGGIKGLAATKPAQGRKFSSTSKAAKAYRAYLVQKQVAAAARVGAKTDRHYAVGLNGFTADLTPAQAKTLSRAEGVLGVTKDVPRQLTDDRNSVDFLKLSGSGGVWSELGGTAKAGGGVVVGILDTGYWPENPSFAGGPLGTSAPTSSDPYRPYRSGAKIVMKKADGGTFTGTCQSGESFAASLCNTKVVGARYFAKTFQEVNGPIGTADYLSPRDGEGHGSHTASTAAGNADVAASVAGHSFGKISGVAPAAKLAVYKVGFTADSGAEGIYGSDAIDAIDAAISDGVDVINYSISGSDALMDPVDLAFLSAASAGIFVAASAGNSGPGASTLDHINPWLTTVAASSVQRYESTLVLGNGQKYAGVSTTVRGTVPSAPILTSIAGKTDAATAANANLCTANTLDPAKVSGKIVVCQRGGNARAAKSAEVKRAGGIAMALLNPVDQDLEGDSHVVPTIHFNPPVATAIRAYAETAGARASMVEANSTGTVAAYPQISPFSSRGPSIGSGGDLLKPDIAAPGVDTLAAVAPPTNNGENYGFLSGTSMASPHVAGLAALYFGVHPRWSPMTVKSAMMTTSSRLKRADGTESLDRYAQGAGNVRPDRMFNPGLVFNSSQREWLAYLEGQGVDTQTGVRSVDPSDFNSPSIAVGSMVDSQTVTRKVTAVKAGVYRATISVPGINASVSPSSFVFTAAGQSKTIKIKLSRDTAATGTAAFGTLFLTGSGTTARVPIAVRPVAVVAPAVVAGTGASGSVGFSITPGLRGSFPLTRLGLAKGEVNTGDVSASQPTATDVYQTTVPAGSKVARFDLAAEGAGADIDLNVYRVVDDVPTLVGSSLSSTGDEEVLLEDPQPGLYLTQVVPYQDPSGATKTDYAQTNYAVGSANLGNFTVTPANPVDTGGQPLTVTASWSGISASDPYLGLVAYPDGSYTQVEVN